MQTTHFANALAEHLSSWGLRRFDSDAIYFQWQRETIPSSDLARLTELAQQKSASPSDAAVEVAFYDFSVRPAILPALYSQRYDYYMAVAPLVESQIGTAQTVVDVGCGPGILTTFYAAQHPQTQFVGIDRSTLSVTLARERAEQLGLKNIRFESTDIDQKPLSGSYDLMISTHAILQSESEPGVPSLSWQTFERTKDRRTQVDFEQRTGLDRRLDHLSAALALDGRLVVFEKTRQLARRTPFQRAFAARDYCQLKRPIPIRYSLVEEIADDGPFYVLGRPAGAGQDCVDWDEAPEDGDTNVDISKLIRSPGKADEPLYEEHSASAQAVWLQLADRRIMQETTHEGAGGQQLHVEIGTAQGLCYLYCANTFDARQVVLVRAEQAGMLEAYYHEIVDPTDGSLP